MLLAGEARIHPDACFCMWLKGALREFVRRHPLSTDYGTVQSAVDCFLPVPSYGRDSSFRGHGAHFRLDAGHSTASFPSGFGPHGVL